MAFGRLMALTLVGLPHGDHTHDSIESVTECILGLRKKADDKDLPGFGGLIDDWFNPDVDVDEEQFVRRFLHVFKQSDKDFTYEDILKGYDDDVQSIVNQFVDGEINAKEAAERYSPFTTLKVPKNIVQNRGLANIIPGERNILEEHTALLRALPTSIPSRIRGLVAKIAPSLKDPKEYLYIPVSPDSRPLMTLTQKTEQCHIVLQTPRVSKPWSNGPIYSYNHMCAKHSTGRHGDY